MTGIKKFFSKVSLRNRLVGINLLIFAAIFVAVAVVFSFSINRQKESVERTLKLHLESVVDKVTQSFFSNYHQVQSFTKNPVLTSGTAKEKQFILNEYLSLFPDNEAFALVDLKGKVVATSTIDRNLTPIDATAFSQMDFGDSPWMAQFQNGQNLQDIEKNIFGAHMLQPKSDLSISGVLNKEWSGAVFIAPLDDGFGGALGYLLSFRNMNWIQKPIQDLKNELNGSGLESSQISIRSSKGQDIARVATPKTRESDYLKVSSAMTGSNFIDSIDWKVELKVAKSEAFYDVNLFSKLIYMVLGLLALFSSVLIFFVANRMYQRLASVVDILGKTSEESFVFTESLTSSADQLTGYSQTLLEKMSTADSSLKHILEKAGVSEKHAGLTVESSNASREYSSEGKSSIFEVVNSIDEVSKSNKQVIDKMHAHNTNLEEMTELMNTVNACTSRIDDIVLQTKLLSFNASVEAARSGDAGKGFAVVAAEVANLAINSGEASREINDILNRAQVGIEKIIAQNKRDIESIIDMTESSIENSIGKSHECQEVLDQIHQQATKVADLAHGISSEVSGQKDGIKDIESAISELNGASAEIGDSAQETSRLATKMSGQSSQLLGALDRLTKEIHGVADKDQEAA